MDTNYAIVIENLTVTKKNGEDYILRNFNLKLPRGANLIIEGHNGSGKSTLLNCMTGTRSFDQGKIIYSFRDDPVAYTLNGRRNHAPSSVSQKVSVVHQAPSLWSMYNIQKNLARPLIDLKGLSKDAAMAESKKWLKDTFGFKESELKRKPQHFSGGERRKIALARALAMTPEILLLDEPENDLDKNSIDDFTEWIAENYLEEDQRTVVIVTHRKTLINKFAASNYLVLKEGAIQDHFVFEEEQKRGQQTLFFPESAAARFHKECLKASREYTDRITVPRIDRSENTYQLFADKFAELVGLVDPTASALVLFVTWKLLPPKTDPPGPVRKTSKDYKDLSVDCLTPLSRKEKIELDDSAVLIRGANITGKGFQLDGKHAHKLGRIVEEVNKFPRLYALKDDADQILKDSIFEGEDCPLITHNASGKQKKEGKMGSAIAIIMENEESLRGYPDRKYHLKVEKIDHSEVPIPPRNHLREGYYQFSDQTEQLFLFPIWQNDTIMGMISVDTTSSKFWDPTIVEDLKEFAQFGALTIRNHYLALKLRRK